MAPQRVARDMAARRATHYTQASKVSNHPKGWTTARAKRLDHGLDTHLDEVEKNEDRDSRI